MHLQNNAVHSLISNSSTRDRFGILTSTLFLASIVYLVIVYLYEGPFPEESSQLLLYWASHGE